jgi:malonyl CoA-acyl carrier protein transacylase
MANDTQFENLSPIKQALYQIRTLKEKVRDLETAQNEPVAIIGMGLRFPGEASTPAALWNILSRGVSTITEIPASRWKLEDYFDADADAPGKMYSRHGSFIGDPAGFDAHFFGISPREAVEIDPQHRLALEVAWETLENSGYSPAAAAENKTGVFLALSNSDYGRLVFNRPDELDAYSSTGNILCVAAGRISYALGLEGPSLVVDTACSGSLVTVHLACQSLRTRECRMALAGGVNLILSPEININFSKARMLAPDGLCKAFDAKADGFVRGEGCGMVALKLLSDAVADGDNILALIHGSAINQDGRSGGLTVPNGKAQETLLLQALANAHVEPREIQYVEAHGTGTALGDPIESRALAAALGTGRTGENPLVVGSIKTNLGHLESAAGVAGLIKVVLSLQNEEIPAHLHFQKLNPHIDWLGVPVQIPVKSRPWKRGETRRLAGVSSFGFSGTNAHLIVQEAPASESRTLEAERPLHVLALSARSRKALQQRKEELAAGMDSVTGDLADLCFTANAGRAHFDERAVFVGATREQMKQALAFPPLAAGTKEGESEIVFLFSGQGSQFAGMGQELYRTQPVFRQTMDECAELLRAELPEPLLEVLWGKSVSLLDHTAYTQPGIFALEYSLAKLWMSWGVQPAAVLGHSVGEYVAACVAGVYSLADGLKLIAKRASMMQAVTGRGAMSAILGSEENVRRAIAGLEQQVSIAALNAPQSVVISGFEDGVSQAEERLTKNGIKVKRLNVSHGFHSPQMAEMEAAFEREAARVQFHSPSICLISSVTGRAADKNELSDPAYWRRQVREPVRFQAAMETLSARGFNRFVEVGPGTTLAGLGRQTISGDDSVWAPSIKKDRGEWSQILESLGKLYACGVEINWAAFDKPYQRRRVALPTYPFERQRYWLSDKPATNKNSAQTDDLTQWEWIRDAADRQSRQCPLGLDVAGYPARWDILDKLTSAFIVITLAKFGVFQAANESHSAQSLIGRCGIRGPYEKLLLRWLNKLANEGLLQCDGEQFISVKPLPAVDIKSLLDNAGSSFAGDRTFLDYSAACGEKLHDVLSGKTSPLETLFPGGSFALAEVLYESSPIAVYFNLIARSTLEGYLRSHRHGTVRVLEIGAGTGSTASALIPALPPDAAEYYFTDVSDIFLNHGERKFADYPFVRYGQLDIERPGAEQGYAHGSFDIIAATNVIHATRNLRTTMDNVKSLLAPGGILILSEATDYLPWLDTTVALIEGWQRFEDGYRGDHPLLPAKTWENILQDSGFERISSFPDAQSPAEVLGRHVIVARVANSGARAMQQPVANASARGMAQKERDVTGALELAALLDAPPEQRHENLVGLVRRQIAEMLRFDSPERVERKRRLIDMGLDSLMAVDLRNRLGKSLRLERPLSATLFFEHPTLDALVDYLERDILKFDRQNETEPVAVDPMNSRADQLEDLNDEEVEAMLLKKLESF